MMHIPADENLPEVVYDTSPQAVSTTEANYKDRMNGRDLYTVQYDDTPKIPVAAPAPAPGGDPYAWQHPGQYHPVSATSATASLPWEPLSAVEETPAGKYYAMGDAASTRAGESIRSEKPEQERRICGFRRKSFFIILLLAIVTMVVAIGGGVGGGMAAARSREAAAATSSSNPDPSPTPAPANSGSSASTPAQSATGASDAVSSTPAPSSSEPSASAKTRTSDGGSPSETSKPAKESKTSSKKSTSTKPPPKTTTTKPPAKTTTSKAKPTTTANLACLPDSCASFGCCSGKCDYWCRACDIEYSC